jgi:DNA replication protein DnaC
MTDTPKTLAAILAENQKLAQIPVEDQPKAPKAKREYRTFRREAVPLDNEGKCPRCYGLSYVRYEGLSIADPRFGRLQDCDNPGCPHVRERKEKRAALFLERMHRHFNRVQEYYPNATPESLKNMPGKTYANQVARLFVAGNGILFEGVVKSSVVLTGAVSLGKTYIASAAYNGLKAKGELVWFTRLWTLLEGVKAGYGDDTELSANQALSALCDAPHLIIDEFQVNKLTEHSLDIVEALVNARSARSMPTLITTNLNQGQVREKFNDRIEARMKHFAHWIEVHGEVMRDTTGIIREEIEDAAP